MGEYINLDSNSVDFTVEKHSQGDRGRGRFGPSDDFGDLGFTPQHHGGGTSDTPAPKAEASDPVNDEPETPNSTEASDMMARFTAAGVGETTSEEQSAIKESKAEIVAKQIADEVEDIHIQEAGQPTEIAPSEAVVGRVLEGAVPTEAPKAEMTKPDIKAPIVEIEPIFESEREALLTQAVKDELLTIDGKGRYAASTAEGEAVLRKAYGIKEISREGKKSTAAEAPKPRVMKSPSELNQEVPESSVGEAPKEVEAEAREAVEIKPEIDLKEKEVEVNEVAPVKPEAEPRVEVVSSNPVYLALEKEITESLNLNKPAERSAFALALLWVFKREVFDNHHAQMVSYNERKDKLESLQKIKDVWDAKIGDLRGEALVMGGEVTEIISGIADGTASKRDQEKLAKKIAQLSNKKEIFEAQQMARTASLLGIEIPEVTQDNWEGVESSSEEFGAIVTKERDDLVADLRQGGSGTRLNTGKVRTLQDLSAETQKLFLTTEGDNSLTRLAIARAISANIKEQVEQFIQENKLADNPLFLYQLYNGLRTAEVDERQAEARVGLAIDCFSKGESLKELKDQVIQRVKKQVGEKAFGVDSGFEVRADTKLSELVLNGNNDLVTTINFYWNSFNVMREMAQKTAFGINNLKRVTTGWLENQVPEITEIGQKHSESLARLAEIRVDLDRVQGNRRMIAEIQKEASDRRQTALENSLEETKRMNTEQKAKTVDSIISGMIGMLEIPVQSKRRMERIYKSEGLSDVFLNELRGYYQKSTLKLERKRKLAEEKLADVLDRKAYLEDVLRKSLAGEMFVSLDEVEDELVALNQQIDEKILANQDRMDIITRDYRAQIRNLESELDEEMYQSILQKLA